MTSPEQVLALMELGIARRHVGETQMNAASSRSHTIFRMVVESREVVAEGAAPAAAPTEEGGTDAVLVATLNLVDLAGSEVGLGRAGAPIFFLYHPGSLHF